MNDTTSIRRKSMRYAPDPNTVVLLSVEAEGDAGLTGLVIDESFEGCSAVFRDSPALVQGARFVCRVGKLDEVPATVAWVRSLDKGVVRAGLALEVKRPSR